MSVTRGDEPDASVSGFLFVLGCVGSESGGLRIEDKVRGCAGCAHGVVMCWPGGSAVSGLCLMCGGSGTV